MTDKEKDAYACEAVSTAENRQKTGRKQAENRQKTGEEEARHRKGFAKVLPRYREETQRDMTEKRDALNRALAEISRQKESTREKISALRKKIDDLREKAPEYRDMYISAENPKHQKEYLEKYERAVQEIRTADEISRELSAGRVYHSAELMAALTAVKAECMEIMDRISKETEANAEKITQALEAIEEAGRQSRENSLFLEAYLLDVVNMVHALNGERAESTLRLVALDEMELSGDPIREAVGADPAQVARVRSVARFCEYTAPEVEKLTQRARTSL